MIRARGFTLIELMVAMVLGLVVSASAFGMFSSALRSANFNEAISELRGEARYALDQISRRARGAGFAGCLDPGSDALNLSVDKAPMSGWQAGAIGAALIGESAWVPGPPAGFTVPSAPKPRTGTHALFLQGGDGDRHRLLEPMASSGSPLVLAGSVDDFVVGELVAISDCSIGDLFEVKSITASGKGTISVQPRRTLSRRYVPRSDEPDVVQAIRYRADIWYVADTGRRESGNNPVHSLYLQSWPFKKTNPPQELVTGVEAMFVSFGVLDADGRQLRQREPAASLPVERIARLELALLASSRNGIVTSPDSRTYRVGATSVSPPAGGSAVKHAGLRRLRQVYDTTVQLRGRLR